MWDLNNLSVNVIEILDPVSVTGAEYFNFFFTIIAVFAMVCFGINVLIRLISRS